MNAQDVMSSPVYPCSIYDSLNEVAELMWNHAVGLVPILDEDGNPIAVITDRDVAMATFLTGRRLTEIPVTESMSSILHTCQVTDTLREVQDKMALTHTRRLPVLDDNNQLVGIVSVDDLIRAATDGWRLLAAPELVRALSSVTYTASHDTGEAASEPVDLSLLERWEEATTQLGARRDELRLKMKLAGMDARDEWARLEGRMQQLQNSLGRAERRAESSIQSALEELSDGYHALQQSLRRRDEE
jgi:CBS domain-containing protein